MTSKEDIAPPQRPRKSAPGANESGQPGWTHGLRQLYDSVVEEDIPDTFKDLLSKLDD